MRRTNHRTKHQINAETITIINKFFSVNEEKKKDGLNK